MSTFPGLSIPTTSPDTRALAASIGPSRAHGTADRDASSAEQARAASQQEFASILSQSVAARGGGAGAKHARTMSTQEKDAQARQAAEDFVAIAFVQPLFKNLRNSRVGPELPPPLGPGPGEKQFRSLADTQVARQLVHASKWPLVDSLTNTLRNAKPRGGHFSAETLKSAPALPGSPAFFKRTEAARSPESPTETKKAGPSAFAFSAAKAAQRTIPLDTTVKITPRPLVAAEPAPRPIALENPDATPKRIPLVAPQDLVPLRFSLKKAKP